jgi:hypothetical protein
VSANQDVLLRPLPRLPQAFPIPYLGNASEYAPLITDIEQAKTNSIEIVSSVELQTSSQHPHFSRWNMPPSNNTQNNPPIRQNSAENMVNFKKFYQIIKD